MTTTPTPPGPTRTTIHDALGLGGPLDHTMILTAISDGLGEGQRLDWKSAHYASTPGRDAGDEFAKDVAAFANARGGLIVIGVKEHRGTSRAKKAAPVEIGDTVERRYRSWISSRIEPMLHGVHLHSLPDPSDATGVTGFLAVEVPASPDLPHMVGSQGRGGYPVRNGTGTDWLREFDIERAYRDRFRRREDDHAALAHLTDALGARVDRSKHAWLVAASRPVSPFPVGPLAPTRDDVRGIFDRAAHHSTSIVPPHARSLGALDGIGEGLLNPRVGLRRWVAHPYQSVISAQISDGGIVEVFHDGSVTLAVPLYAPGEVSPDFDTLPDAFVTGLAADLVGLAHEVEVFHGRPGAHVMRIEHRGAGSKLLTLYTGGGPGLITQRPGEVSGSRRLDRLEPVEVVAPDLTTVDGRREVTEALVLDVAHQFAVQAKDIRFDHDWPTAPGT